MANVDLVILDLDGTLYSSTATTLGAVERAVRDLNERHGDVAAPPSDDLVLSGVGSTREDFARKVFPALAEEYIEEIDDLIWHWERTLVDDGAGCPLPGCGQGARGDARDGVPARRCDERRVRRQMSSRRQPAGAARSPLPEQPLDPAPA